MNVIQKLKFEISNLENELQSKKETLQLFIAQCKHKWGAIMYDPIKVNASVFPGDTVGGIDRRPAMHIPEQVTKRWTRTCLNCGYVQATYKSQNGPDIPVFRDLS